MWVSVGEIRTTHYQSHHSNKDPVSRFTGTGIWGLRIASLSSKQPSSLISSSKEPQSCTVIAAANCEYTACI